MALLRTAPVQLKITRPRKTKFGDYRFPAKDGHHRISINANLNPYAFLITLIHEMAHLRAFEDYGRKIKPHGEEWQQTFKKLALPFLEAAIFPRDIQIHFENSLNKGSASSCTDINLFRQLKVYDDKPQDVITVEQLPEGAYFAIDNKKVFKKGAKMRKRYRCTNLANGRDYMVHPLAEVKKIDNDKISKSA